MFQLLNCSVYLVLILAMAWRNFKMEQQSILVFADIVTVLAAAAAVSSLSSATPPASTPTNSFFSLAPEVVERAQELMLKCASHASSVTRQQFRHDHAHVAPLCGSVRDACASHLVLFEGDNDSSDAAAEDASGCSLHDVLSVASSLLQRLSLMESAKSSAHHTIFGIAVDTALLLSTVSFTISGIASGLSSYWK